MEKGRKGRRRAIQVKGRVRGSKGEKSKKNQKKEA